VPLHNSAKSPLRTPVNHRRLAFYAIRAKSHQKPRFAPKAVEIENRGTGANLQFSSKFYENCENLVAKSAQNLMQNG
jgi:hypothetical protein